MYPQVHLLLPGKINCFVISLLCLLFSLNGYAASEPNNRNDTTIQFAEITSQWGQLTRSHSPGEAAKTLAAQQLSSAVTSTLTPWFNQYGNTRLTVPFDSRFSLKGLSFDWLLPWYQTASGAPGDAGRGFSAG
ncbi:inverse autotransporter-like protein with beta domain [Xenorhabdus doucetiae]|uniref:Inverse autotransporter-like protein with beta domain n=1 Tax=Xenorhabdus doucetiae TaxID=351671 RepID=A0ABY3NMH7_9GAMM|nr:inverse autotransporter-like protein with beta domain [Xenorhabdus doucetiae]